MNCQETLLQRRSSGNVHERSPESACIEAIAAGHRLRMVDARQRNERRLRQYLIGSQELAVVDGAGAGAGELLCLRNHTKAATHACTQHAMAGAAKRGARRAEAPGQPLGDQPLDALPGCLIMLRMAKNAIARSPSARQHYFDRMNIAVLGMQLIAWAACLKLAPVVANTLWLPLLIVFFCLMMQGVFSMMHECFHGHGHRNPAVNVSMCWLATTIFGASATLIRINHLGHHVRNRTSAELVDFIEPDESVLKKIAAYYVAIFGGIWLASCIGSLALALLPSGLAERLRSKSDKNTYSAAFADFEPRDFARIRCEVLGGIVWFGLAFWLLELQVIWVLIFYAALAFSWSSLQWIYHVRTPLDVIEGTYNLRAPWFIRMLFLNFNYNLTHHRNPALRWQEMDAVSDRAETRPLWYAWLSIFRPPVPLPLDGVIEKSYF
jgi:fatty acid desaturase